MIMANSANTASINNTTNNNNNNSTNNELQLSVSSASSSQANTPSSSTSATTNSTVSSIIKQQTTITATTIISASTTSNINNQSKSTAQAITSTTITTNDLLNNENSNNSSSNGSSNTPSTNTSNQIADKWIFPLEKIENSPSRLDGISLEDELSERQEAALFIADLGAMLKVNQLCINTAIIYMHRFFMIHSLKKFHRYVRMVATSCLFFACKVEEQPKRLREFIEAIHRLLHKSSDQNPITSEDHQKYTNEITTLESCLLQTLGFNVLINHAHTVIIKTCQMIKAPRDLAEAAYLTATNSLILTNFCVKLSPEKVACFCIYLACKWTGIKIPTSSEGLQWYQYVKDDIVEQELEDISKEYLNIYMNCPPKVQKKLGKAKNPDDKDTHGDHHQAAQQQKLQHQTHKSHKQIPSQHPNPQLVKKLPDNKQQPNLPSTHPQHQIVNSNIQHKQYPPHHPSKPIHNGIAPPSSGLHQHQKQLQYQKQQQQPRPVSGTSNGQPQQKTISPQTSTKDPNLIKQQHQQIINKNTSNIQQQATSSHHQNLNKSNGSIQTGVPSQSKPLSQTASLSNLSTFSQPQQPNLNINDKKPASLTSSPNTTGAVSLSSSSLSQPTQSTSMKRVNEDMQTAPTSKIAKYVIDQKST